VYVSGATSTSGCRNQARDPYACWMPGACVAAASVRVQKPPGAQLAERLTSPASTVGWRCLPARSSALSSSHWAWLVAACAAEPATLRCVVHTRTSSCVVAHSQRRSSDPS
jgi:hypothetical protein